MVIPATLGTVGQGRAGGQAEACRLTSKGRHRCRLAVAGPQDGRDDVVNKALCDAHLEQGLSHRALGHVDEAGLPQRIEQLLHAREGVTVGLVLIDPGRHVELEPLCRKVFGLTTRCWVTAPGLTAHYWVTTSGRLSRGPPSSPCRGQRETGYIPLGLFTGCGGPVPARGTVQREGQIPRNPTRPGFTLGL